MPTLFAQPYDPFAEGFFESATDYAAKTRTAKNRYGDWLARIAQSRRQRSDI